MDPCPFFRIVVGGIALKFPVSSKPAFSGIHPSSSPCFCKIELKSFPFQIASIPLISQQSNQIPSSPPTCFNLNKTQFDKLVNKSINLNIKIYTGQIGNSCGLSSGKLLGRVLLPLHVKSVESRTVVVQNGWVIVNEGAKGKREAMQLHLHVKAEPDPRFVFQFDGKPECSPQVFQVNGNARQPVFTCKFSLRNSSHRLLRSRSSLSEPSTSLNWFHSLKNGNKEQPVKERKGWSIIIHDLSGSPVAAASMVTPFVPSPGTDRVSRSNSGAWLILRPGANTWNPWGRLEVWRERRGNYLGYRFDLLPDAVVAGVGDAITVANSTLSTKNGGKFTIDIGNGASPASSRSNSFDLGSGDGSGSGSWDELLYRGFVMSSTLVGGGSYSTTEVEVGVQHVACTEDAAAFVALAAAMDLSVEACRPFSQKLRKGLVKQQSQELVVR